MNFNGDIKEKNNSLSMTNIHNPNKQILFDMERDKYYLKMSNSKKLFESNKLGKIIPKNNLGQTGYASYNERIKTNTIDKLNFKIDDSLYHPQSLLFEGYTQFPRPIIFPFANLKKIKLQKSLINNLRKNHNLFSVTKNRNILKTKTNEGLYFYSGTINEIENKKNKQIVLDNINNALSYEEKMDIFNRNNTMSNHEKKALIKIKKKIISNSTNTIFGRKLTKPDEKFVRQYKINYNIFFNNQNKMMLKKKVTENYNNLYFKDLYMTLNKKSVQQTLNLPKKNVKKYLKDEIINNLENKNIYSNKDTNYKTATTKFYEDNELSPSVGLVTNKKNKRNSENNIFKPNNNENSENFFHSLHTIKDNKFNTLENESFEKYKNILSDENEEKSKKPLKSIYNKFDTYQKNKLNIKTLNDINDKCLIETKLLEGFNKPDIKERNYRRAVPKYNSPINIYKKEIEMFKLVNPIRNKLDEEKELKEIKYIEERRKKGKYMVSYLTNKMKK
jgi:hypothetical protein